MGPDNISAPIQVVAGHLGYPRLGARWLETAGERVCIGSGSLVNNHRNPNNHQNPAAFCLPGLCLASAGLLAEPPPAHATVVLKVEQSEADVVISGGGFAEITDFTAGVR
jgi:hypothetical protein